jgi:hypothetical protein
MKTAITFLDVVSREVANRVAARSPRQAAVQWSRSMKWTEMRVHDTSRQPTILPRSLNWNERMSKNMAIPTNICDRAKSDMSGDGNLEGRETIGKKTGGL